MTRHLSPFTLLPALALLILPGCSLSISELGPSYMTRPLSFLAGTWADTPACRDASTTVRFTPPTTQSFTISIYEREQLVDRIDCRNEWGRTQYMSRLTALECGLGAQVYINQIDQDTIEFQFVNVAQAPSTLRQSLEAERPSVRNERLYRCAV